MHLLWIATKPPWPSVDGGRLVMATTIEALAGEGAKIDLVAPSPATAPSLEPAKRALRDQHLVPASGSKAAEALSAFRWPLSIARHRAPAVRDLVADLIASRHYDAVHVEQVQAFLQAEPILDRIPVVLRAQNVESDLWRRTSRWGQVGSAASGCVRGSSCAPFRGCGRSLRG